VCLKTKAIQWASKFSVCCCLDSNGYTDVHGRFDCLIAAGASDVLSVPESGKAFEALRDVYDTRKNWLFGLLSYDLKNETEALHSANEDPLGFPVLYFFVPEYLVGISGNDITVLIGPESIANDIRRTEVPATASVSGASLSLTARFSKADYLDTVKTLKNHILRGNIYEVTFCQEFYARNAEIDALALYLKLNSISPTPFSSFFKMESRYILCASPERYLCKRGKHLYSQPIKGTAKRSTDPVDDHERREALRTSIKERAENVMIVDLVRNDLTRCAKKGGVCVDELFGLYSFPQVHQLISTVSCEMEQNLHPVRAIQNTFPMGSMTGAPKISAMELIEQYERSRRGAYSGALGYFSPDGDFDFNVIIRSILYNQQAQYLSFHVGGAITYLSDAEAEYEECLLKAKAIKKAISYSISSPQANPAEFGQSAPRP